LLFQVCIVIKIDENANSDAFMQEHEAEILESGYILETTKVNKYF